MVSPKLVPPASEEELHVRPITDLQSQVSTNPSEAQSEEGKPVFNFNSKSTATVDTSTAVAEPATVSEQGHNTATTQLTRLAQMVQEHYSFSDDNDAIEMTSQVSEDGASGQRSEVNVTDEAKEQAATLNT